jgi:PPP family 3-phenylpropionic acid transporter
MRPRTRAIVGNSFAARLAVFYAGLFAVIGIQLPFFPLWLEAKGLTPADIGLVLAAPMLVRLLAVPAIARIADHQAALRQTLIIASLAATAGCVSIGLSQSFSTILAAVVVTGLAFTPLIPLADAYALKGLGKGAAGYGPIRLWGSAAFIGANLTAGFLADLIARNHLIWLMLGAFVLAAGAAAILRPLEDEGAKVALPHGHLWQFLLSPALVTVVAAASLIQASHAVYYSFSSLDWAAQGFSGAAVGALWALGVLAEIALFAAAPRLPSAVGPWALLGFGAAGGVVRWTAMALDPPMFVLPLLQLLHAFSFGATHLGSVQILGRLAPNGLGATAQGVFATALALVMAGATALAGLLYGTYGSFAYAAMALVAAAGGLCVLAAMRSERAAARGSTP